MDALWIMVFDVDENIVMAERFHCYVEWGWLSNVPGNETNLSYAYWVILVPLWVVVGG
jgi:hypothetical protein